jgi:NUMOD3 motif
VSIVHPKRFYVYILYRPDGSPFYVGKGSGNRMRQHESFARMGSKKSHVYAVIRKIWREGGEVTKYQVLETEDEREAYAMEAYLIDSIGRENLANQSDGGRFRVGYSPSEETRKRIAATLRGRKMSSETLARVQAAKIGRPRSQSCKEKIRAALTGRTLPPEHVEKVAAGHRGQKRSEEARRNISESLRGKPHPHQRGERHFHARLTEDVVRAIRAMHRAGQTKRSICRAFNLPDTTVWNVIARKTWAWLDD